MASGLAEHEALKSSPCPWPREMHSTHTARIRCSFGGVEIGNEEVSSVNSLAFAHVLCVLCMNRMEVLKLKRVSTFSEFF